MKKKIQNIAMLLTYLRNPACACGCESGEWRHDGRTSSKDYKKEIENMLKEIILDLK